MYIYIYIYMYIYTFIFIHVYTICIYLHGNIYIHMYLHIRSNIFDDLGKIYVMFKQYLYIYIHTHIRTELCVCVLTLAYSMRLLLCLQVFSWFHLHKLLPTKSNLLIYTQGTTSTITNPVRTGPFLTLPTHSS